MNALTTHALDYRLTFTTDAGDLHVTVCTCGRMFDDARFAVHVGVAA